MEGLPSSLLPHPWKRLWAYKIGGMMFEDDPMQILLSGFQFRVGDRFEYAYDFTAGWHHDLRIEAIEKMNTEVIAQYALAAMGFAHPKIWGFPPPSARSANGWRVGTLPPN
jgi:hypothetical protein